MKHAEMILFMNLRLGPGLERGGEGETLSTFFSCEEIGLIILSQPTRFAWLVSSSPVLLAKPVSSWISFCEDQRYFLVIGEM